VTGRSRSRQLPEVPTVGETPGLGGFEAVTGWALWAPAGTPKGAIKSLHDAAVRMLRRPEIQEKLERAGADEIIGNTPEQMAANMKSDLGKFGELVKAAGIEPE
jgi:tripartite-type tricarboxylate transporter receptor subunit TctC